MSVTIPGMATRSAAEVMAAARPAYMGTWPETIAYLRSSPLDNEIIEHLRADLRRDGAFREPVLVRDGQLGNGTHRVIAAHLEGTAVQVTSREESPGVGQWTDIEFTVTSPAGADLDAQFEAIVDLLCSFPHPGDPAMWIESVSMSCHAGVYEATMTMPYARAAELVDLVASRIARSGAALASCTAAAWQDHRDAGPGGDAIVDRAGVRAPARRGR